MKSLDRRYSTRMRGDDKMEYKLPQINSTNITNEQNTQTEVGRRK